jgi:hypothetical protein
MAGSLRIGLALLDLSGGNSGKDIWNGVSQG